MSVRGGFQALDIRELLNKFNILDSDEFIEELISVLRQCQNPNAVLSKLVFCLQRMKDSPNTYFIDNPKLFESIIGQKGQFAITIQIDGDNVRILHARILGRFIFLLAFYKKGGKKATDYEKHLPIAEERLKRAKANLGGTQNGCKR
jgi:hypothetical protein